MNDGLDVWCHDAVETPVYPYGSAGTAVLQSLEVVETFFDGNPAVYTTELLGRRSFEHYLAAAAPDDKAAR